MLPSRLTVLVLLTAWLFPVMGFGQQPGRVILPGDLVEISCDRVGQLCVLRVVNEDGTILLPDLGSVGIATMTTEEIESKLARLIASEGLAPAPSVKVYSRYLKGEAIGIAGAVKAPFVLHYGLRTRLSDLLQLAEPALNADIYSIRVSHADGTQEVASSHDDLILIDGDRVSVPLSMKSHSIEVVGGVNKPSQLDFRSGLTLEAALNLAGGVSERSKTSRILVERDGEQIPVSVPEDLSLVLALGDRVRVDVGTEIQHVIVSGNVNHPQLVDLLPGMTVTQAVASCGGVLGSKGEATVILKRKTKEGVQASTRLIFKQLLAKTAPDPLLSPNDIVEIEFSVLKSRR